MIGRTRTRRRQTPVLPAAALAALAAVPVPPAAASGADGAGDRATIRYTEYGIPHILAEDFDGLGYGYGYAAAKDNICELADIYLTVGAQRSRYLGPGGSGNSALSSARSNLSSDLHFQRINSAGTVEQLVAQPAPFGPREEVREIVEGYVDGYNRYLAETGPEGITDPACHAAPWVRPISDLDVYRHFYAISSVAGQGALVEGIVGARPLEGGAPVPANEATARRFAAGLADTFGSDELGSNGIAIGADGAAEGSSVLLGNPHYPWHGGRRFWQSQLTVPGKMNVSGASLLGIPLIQIGFTQGAAWTHTVATPRTFGLYELELAPGDPTSYLVDGAPEKMTTATVQVQVKQPDGTLTPVRHTFHGTRYGPMLDSAPGVELPWTGETGYAVRDANATNMRGLNTWFELSLAQSTDEIVHALSNTQGVPWVNTIATDRAGNALYADIQVVPHVTDELAQRCGTALGQRLFPATGVPVLDGSTRSCAWGSDPGAIEPGLFAPERLPVLQRSDYVLNANDSAWLSNPHAPITNYPRIVGDVGTERSARTREAILRTDEVVQGKGFTTDSMRRLLFDDHSRMAELAAMDTARMCSAFRHGRAPSADGPVDVRAGCRAVARWDHSYDLDSRGSLLFERFVGKLSEVEGGPWVVPFDPDDPLHTPNTLNIHSAQVRGAFGDAAAELLAAGIPLDGRLGDHQYVMRSGERIGVHGSRHGLGVLNVITPQWDAGKGNTEVMHGSSHIQVVGFGKDACPNASTLLTYSQSTDPTSLHHADQTRLFSEGEWVRSRFCEEDILAAPQLRVVHLD
jgi:acyl-homoserine-lactone acylase